MENSETIINALGELLGVQTIQSTKHYEIKKNKIKMDKENQRNT